nr:hypothetical protein [Pectobacterium parmentieri]
MTQGNYNSFKLWKTQAGVWLPPVVLWHTGNLAPFTLDTDQDITGVKYFRRDGNAFNLRPSPNHSSYIFCQDTADKNKWYIGTGADNSNNAEFYNYIGRTGIELTAFGDVNLVAPSNALINNNIVWHEGNLQKPANLNTSQTFTGDKVFTTQTSVRGAWPSFLFFNSDIPPTTVGHLTRIEISIDGAITLISRNATDTIGQRVITFPKITGGNVLVTGNNVVADSGGFYKTASPVINIYADGSFTTTHEAIGVNVERLSEGVYKITGCQGMHSDAAWNGIDGGVSNPKCRNDKALLWNNYEVAEDGSVTVYTFHRVHPDAMPFAQNRLTLDKQPFDAKKGHKLEETWPDQSPIDVPRGAFIQVRVNMPGRIEPYHAISHSNVYCNTIFLA